MFTVDLAFTGEVPPSLRLGQALRVQIELGNPERVLTIPRGDFYSVTGGQWIYKVVPGESVPCARSSVWGGKTPSNMKCWKACNPATVSLRPATAVMATWRNWHGTNETKEIV